MLRLRHERSRKTTSHTNGRGNGAGGGFFKPGIAAVLLALLAAGCNQDSIFDYISGETAPTEAKIKGSLSRIVGATIGGEEKLYLTNGRIWEYAPVAPGSSWNRIAGPEGFVIDVAATSEGASDSVLYALTIDNTATGVWKYDGTSWTELVRPDDYGFIQNIFGAGDVLFATGAKRAGNAYDYALFYCKQTEQEFSPLQEAGAAINAVLSGAGKVGSDYYLATRGNGVYKTSDFSDLIKQPAFNTEPDANGAPVPVPVPSDITGFLQAQDSIIGVSKAGHILYIDSSGIRADPSSLGGTYTGALALTDIPDPIDGFDKLLLLGYINQSSTYTHGYKELWFKSGDWTHDGAARTPGDTQPSSVSDYRQYDSSLRRYPVTALQVLPPSEEGSPPVIFAATSNQGLYSYRDRSDGGWQWNHEE
jgi:hypothetical protein